MLSPISYNDSTLRLNINTLKGVYSNQIAVGTDKFLEDQCDLLIRSIGYTCVQIDPDLPFNTKEGIVENYGGRIQGNSYVTGWARTGPFGIIDTTMRNVFVLFI